MARLLSARTARPKVSHAVALLALLGACARPAEPPSWSLLAEGLRPEPRLDALGTDLHWGGQPVLWFAGREPGRLRLSVRVPASAWKSLGQGVFWAPRPLGAQERPRGAEPTQVWVGETELSPLVVKSGHERRLVEIGELPLPKGLVSLLANAGKTAAFRLLGSRVILILPRGESPPEGVRMEEPVPLGWSANDRWRLRLGGLTTDGIPLVGGVPVVLDGALAPGDLLRFSTVAMGRPAAGDPGQVRFVLRAGERILFDGRQPLTPGPVPVRRAVSLPEDLDGDAPLSLTAEGPLCMAAILEPCVGPAEIGSAPDRPWGDSRPDLVLFIADTFRADNMADWGGDPELTPHLNSFAQSCRRYLHTESPATWTLPAHAAFFSGLYPPQLGVMVETDVLPDEAWTLAEHLSAAGYRTAAVTEAAYLSASFGMAQGFEWFEEHQQGLDHTLEVAERLLAQDDGRPLFLVVHTYAAHAPYEVSAATRARLGESYEFAKHQDEVIPKLRPVWGAMERGVPTTAEETRQVRGFEHLYRGGAADLDRGFEHLRKNLDDAGFDRHGLLIFISDHGEAFGEHGSYGHGSAVWEEQSRVPFLVRGPGIDPVAIEDHVGLIDLPRTVVGLLGVEAHSEWMGRDLGGSGGPAPVFSFQTRTVAGFNDWAVVYQGFKWILPLDQDGKGEVGAPTWAYDLKQDGGELQNIFQAERAAAALEELRPLMDAVQVRLLEGEGVQLSDAERARLKALGYAGED